MSALQVPVPSPAIESRATPLRAVPSRPSRQIAQLPFVLIIALLLGGGMTGVLVLSTTIQTQSAELSTLQAREAELRYQEAALVAQARSTGPAPSSPSGHGRSACVRTRSRPSSSCREVRWWECRPR